MLATYHSRRVVTRYQALATRHRVTTCNRSHHQPHRLRAGLRKMRVARSLPMIDLPVPNDGLPCLVRRLRDLAQASRQNQAWLRRLAEQHRSRRAVDASFRPTQRPHATHMHGPMSSSNGLFSYGKAHQNRAWYLAPGFPDPRCPRRNDRDRGHSEGNRAACHIDIAPKTSPLPSWSLGQILQKPGLKPGLPVLSV